MRTPQRHKSRFSIAVIFVAAAALFFLFASRDYSAVDASGRPTSVTSEGCESANCASDLGVRRFSGLRSESNFASTGLQACGQWRWIRCGIDNWPAFFPSGSQQPWIPLVPVPGYPFPDPIGQYWRVWNPQFAGSFGGCAPYQDPLWVVDLSGHEVVSSCGTSGWLQACGQWRWIRCGIDNWPAFFPSGLQQPWIPLVPVPGYPFPDPIGQYWRVWNPQFAGSFGSCAPYQTPLWVVDLSVHETVSSCGTKVCLPMIRR